MSLFTYTAAELYSWVTGKEDIVVVDVRNTIDFGKFHLESPFPIAMHNIPYFDFIEDEDGEFVVFGEHGFEREHDARNFTA